MLEGVLRYLDPKVGWVSYRAIAMSGQETLRLRLSLDGHNYEKGKVVYDADYDNPYAPTGDSRRLDIKFTNRYASNCLNRQFGSRVAAAVRYALLTGKHRRSIGSSAYTSVRKYVVETLDDSWQKDIGHYVLTYGILSEISISLPYVQLSLCTVPDDVILDSVDGAVLFSKLREFDDYGHRVSLTKIDNVGYALDRDTLGLVTDFEKFTAAKAAVSADGGLYETLQEVLAAHRMKNIDYMTKRKYIIVDDSNLESIIAEFKAHDGVLAVDFETSGLNITFNSALGRADQLAGVCLSKKVGTGYFFPLQMKRIPNLCGGDHFYFMERYMKELLETKEILLHNTAFDWKVAYIYGINMNVKWDTMLMLGVTKRYEILNYEIGLKSAVKNLLGWDMLDLADFSRGGTWGGHKFWDLSYELVLHYGPVDADMTLELYEYLMANALLDVYSAHRVHELEVGFAKVVAYSEFYGYPVDVDQLPALRKNLEESVAKYKARMFAEVGYEFNPGSAQQLSRIIYDELQIPIDSAKKSTKKDLLKPFAKEELGNGEPRYPFLKNLLAYRDAAKLLNSFASEEKISEFMSEDGFIHPKVHQLGTETGRVSISEPNYQSYDKNIKKYIKPRDGFIFVDSDFSQIEYRVLAVQSGEEALLRAFEDPDMDYHAYQAGRMNRIPEACVSDELRSASKGVNFGLPYGMEDMSLGARIFGVRSYENMIKARQLRKLYFEGQDKVRLFFDRVRSEGVKKGYTETCMKRRRYYHRSLFSVSSIRRQAGNHVIQGSAAEYYKIAVVRMFERICKEGWLGLVLFDMFVHDETLFEVHKSINLDYFLKIWKEEYELELEGGVRLYAGIGFGNTWLEAKSADLGVRYVENLLATRNPLGAWDEDIQGWVKWVYSEQELFNIKRVCDYLNDSENSGKVPKAIILKLMNNAVLDIVIRSIKENAGIVENSAAAHFRDAGVKMDVDGLLTGKVKGGKFIKAESVPFQLWVRVFCEFIAGIDYTTVDIIDPMQYSKSLGISESESSTVASTESDELTGEELIKSMVSSFGAYLDADGDTVYMQFIQQQSILNMVQQLVMQNIGIYKFYLVDIVTGVTYSTPYKVSSALVPLLQSLCRQVRV